MISSTSARAGTDWRTLLLLLYSLLAAAFLVLSAAVTAFGALYVMYTKPDTQNVARLVLAGGLMFVALLMVPGIYYGGQRVLGHGEAQGQPLRLHFIDWVLFLGGWTLVLLSSEWLLKQEYGWVIAPLFTSLSVLLPIWFLVKLGGRGLPLASRLRSWGALNSGLAFTPVLIIIIEGMIVIGLLIVVGVYIGLQPGALEAVRRFGMQMENAVTEEQVLALVRPYAAHPLTIFSLLTVFSLIAPVVEEILKTSLLWFSGRRVHSPAEGFVLGLLCGAGFTIVETIGSSSSGLDAWSAAMLTRLGSDLVHIVNGGLMGWAIISALHEKRYGRFAATLLLVILLHSLWNACTIFMTLGILYLEIPEAPSWAMNAIVTGAGGLLTLAVGNVTVLFLSNRRLRAGLPPSADPDSPAPLPFIESGAPLQT